MTQNVQLFYFSPFLSNTVLKSLDVCTHCTSLDCLSLLMFAFPHCNSNRFFFYVALVCCSHVFFRLSSHTFGSHIPDNAAFYATALLAQPELVLCLRVCVIHMQISMLSQWLVMHSFPTCFPPFSPFVCVYLCKSPWPFAGPFFFSKINNSYFVRNSNDNIIIDSKWPVWNQIDATDRNNRNWASWMAA